MLGKLKHIMCIFCVCLSMAFALAGCNNETHPTHPAASNSSQKAVTIPTKKPHITAETTKQKPAKTTSKNTEHPTAENQKAREHKMAKLNGQKTPSSRVLAAGGYISGALGGS